MVLYGERFDYSEPPQHTQEQQRVARCRAEAASWGRDQARRWRARKTKAARKQGAAPVCSTLSAEPTRARHGKPTCPQSKAPMAKSRTSQ